jgi:cyclic pyranopterin phosphate synthase
MEGFTHLDEHGHARMVDVGGKEPTRRMAKAAGRITMSAPCYDALKNGGLPKGDALAVARIAGIMATKKTAELIPLCHPLPLTKAGVDFLWDDNGHALEAVCIAECTGQTGVEMEALTGATVALLTIYDMCKALDKTMVIGDVRLLEKRGGKSGAYLREDEHA